MLKERIRPAFAAPLLVSLALSASALGSNVYWQDSGGYLTAVRELGVLYPPGFTLYLLLAHLWTRLLFFADFAWAVHSFSALCAALAAGVLGLAVRDFLRSRGPLLGDPSGPPPSVLDEACGAAAGVLCAGGYTFWFTGIYAKGYSFFFLVLALLLRQIVRADELRRPRDFTAAAALIGLAWQAHPSASLAGAALIWFVLTVRREVGWAGVAWRTGLAAACALGPSLVLLPIFVSRSPDLMLADFAGAGDVIRYIAGHRFTSMDGVWGWDGVRASSFGQYLWEEFLGVGLVLLAAGVSLLAVRRRAAAGWMAAWIVPYVGVTILFKIEGQHDCWFVAAWMPLHLAVGLGLRRIAGRLPPAGQAIAPAVAALAGLAWAFLANHALLDQRRYGLAADLGGLYLDSVDPDAVVLLQGDDSNALALYLQRIRGRRPDVLLVHSPFLFMSVGEGRDWYDDRLLARHSFLRRPSYARTWSRMPDAEVSPVAVAAFLNANAGCGRPLFTELAPPAALLREDYELIPAGVLWKWVPAGTEAPDPRHWNVPIEAEALAGRFGRERGQEVRVEGGRIEVRPENYERRLLRALLQARRARAEDELRRGRFADALPRYESILRLDAEAGRDPGIAFGRGIALHGAGRGEDAEEALLRALALGLPSASAAEALSILGEGRRKRGDGAGAQEYFRRALAVPGLPPAVRGRIEERARTP